MKAKLTGIQNYNKLQMQDKSVLDGSKLFYTYVSPDVKGEAADGKFITRETLELFGLTYENLVLCVGTEINIEYGPKNKIVGISVVTPTVAVQGKIK